MATLLDNMLRNTSALPNEDVSGLGQTRRGLRGALIGTEVNSALADAAAARAAGDEVVAADRLRRADLLRSQQGMAPVRVGRIEDITNAGDAVDWAAGTLGSAAGSMAAPLAAGTATAALGTALQLAPNAGVRAAGRGLRTLGTPAVPFAINAEQMKGEFYGNALEDQTLMRSTSAQDLNNMANAVGVAGGALDTILPTTVARGLAGAGLRQGLRGGGAGRFAGNTLLEGATETAQGELGRQARGYLNPEQDTSGFASDRINEFAAGAVGGAPFAAAGELADGGYRRVGDAASRAGDMAGQTLDLLGEKAAPAVDALRERGGQAMDIVRGKTVDLKGKLKEATGNGRSSWQETQEEIDLLTLTPRNVDPADNEAMVQWMVENDARRADLVRERISALPTDDPEVQAVVAALQADPNDASAIDQGATLLADDMRRGSVVRAAGRFVGEAGNRAGNAARRAGETAMEFGRAVWEGARRQNRQGGEAVAPVGEYLRVQTQSQRRKLGQNTASVARFMGRLGRELESMAQAGVQVDDRTMLHLDHMAQHLAGAFGRRAGEVAQELERMLPGDLTTALTDRVNAVMTNQNDTVDMRRSAADRLVGLVPPQVEKRLLRDGVNLRTDEGKRMLLGLVEALAMGRVPASRRAELAELVGDDTVTAMIQELAPAPAAADQELLGDDASADLMRNAGLQMDEDGNIVDADEAPDAEGEGTTDFEVRQGEKKIDRQSGATYYGFGRRSTFVNSKEKRDPFGYTRRLTAAEREARMDTGESTRDPRPQLLAADQTVTGEDGERVSALRKKVADMERYLGVDEDGGKNIRVAPRTASEVMESMGMQPAKRMQLFADYMFQEAESAPTPEAAEKFRKLGRDATAVLQDMATGAYAGRGAISGKLDARAKSTAGQRAKTREAMQRYFDTRYLVVGETLSDTDPERVERADFDNMVKTGKTIMAQREAKADMNRHAHKNNVLFFEDAEGNSQPILAADVVKFARRARQMNEMDAEGGTRAWVNDLLTGISALLESGLVTAMPTRLDAAGNVESFDNGIPNNLILPTGKLYGEVLSKRRREAAARANEPAPAVDRDEEVAIDQARNDDFFVVDDTALPERSDQDEVEGLRIRTREQGMQASNLPRGATGNSPTRAQLNAASDAALARANGQQTSRAGPASTPAQPSRFPTSVDVSTPRKFLDSLRAVHDANVAEAEGATSRFRAATGMMNVTATGDAAQRARTVELIKQLEQAAAKFDPYEGSQLTPKQSEMATYLLRRLRQSHASSWREDDAPEVAARPGKPSGRAGVAESRIDAVAETLLAEIDPAYRAAMSGTVGALYAVGRDMHALGQDLKGFKASPLYAAFEVELAAMRLRGGKDARLARMIKSRVDGTLGQLFSGPYDQLADLQVMAVAQTGGTLAQAMARVAGGRKSTTAMKVIADAVSTVAGNSRLRLPTDTQRREMQGTAGFYDPATDEITMIAPRNAAMTALHEGVHAATLAAVVKDEKLQKALYSLMAHVAAENPALAQAYGMTNTLEFLAEGLTNREFMRELYRIKPSSAVAKYLGQTFADAWEQFVALMRDALKIAPEHDSALAQLIELGGRAALTSHIMGSERVGQNVRNMLENRFIPKDKLQRTLDELRNSPYLAEGEGAEAVGDLPDFFTHIEASLITATVKALPSLRNSLGRPITAQDIEDFTMKLAEGNEAMLLPLKLNAQTSAGGPQSTPEAQAAAREYIERVLGPAVKVQFAALTGYSGEWVDAENTIYISTTPAPGTMQVAYHEALHAFFSKFVKDDRAYEVLQALADHKPTIDRVVDLLAGDQAALAQLADGEERLAYIYQFWAAGLLQLPMAEPRTLFQKIKRFFRTVSGMVNDTGRATAILEALHRGDFAKGPVAGAQALQEKLQMGTSAPRMLRKMDGLVQKAAALTMPAESVLKTSASETARRIGDLFFVNPGEDGTGKQPGYMNARDQMAKRYTNEFSRLMAGLTEPDYKAVHEYMASGTELADIPVQIHRKAVKDMRALLKRFREYMVDERGMKIGDLGDKYYPRVWSMDKLMQNQDGFLRMMSEKYPQHDAMAVLNALVMNTAADIQAGRPVSEDGVLSPMNRSAEERTLSFIQGEDAMPFLEDNLVGVMTRYFHEGARAAEYTSRFGQDGKELENMLLKVEIELKAESRKLMRQGVLANEKAADAWHARQYRDVRQSIGAMEGTLGKDISAAWRATNSWVVAYQNIRLLPLSLFASVVDPIGLVARGAEMNEAFDAFKRGLVEVGRSWKNLMSDMPPQRRQDQWERMAEYIGSVDAAAFEGQVSDMYASVYMNPTAKKWNDTFFKLNGMEGWNRGVRIGATKAAVQFIQRHSALPQKDSKRWLDELGIKPGDVVLDAEGNMVVSVGEIAALKGVSRDQARDIAGRLHAGINRWVTGAVLTPNAAQRPAWSSDPHYSMFFHLKQFTYSFHQTILKRAAREGMQGNITPMLALFAYIPIMIGSDLIKGLIQGGGELPSHMKGMDAGDWILYGAERSGIAGLGMIGIDAGQDLSSVAGPAVEQIIDSFSDPLERTAVNALPASPLLREALL